MRKRIIPPVKQDASPTGENWLDLERLAQAEITSEDAAYPIESALLPGQVSGWRATEPGEQTIRRAVVPGDRASAMELQPPRCDLPDGRPSRRSHGGHGA